MTDDECVKSYHEIMSKLGDAWAKLGESKLTTTEGLKTSNEGMVAFYNDIPSSPELPKPICYICDKEPKGFYFRRLFDKNVMNLTGNCCGRTFDYEIPQEAIDAGKVTTYIVNMM